MKKTFALTLVLGLAWPLCGPATAAPDDVLASYPGVTITEADLRAEIDSIRAQKEISVAPDRSTIFKLVDNMLLRQILAREAEAGRLIDEQELATRLARQRDIWLADARMEDLARKLSDEQLEAAAQEIYVARPEEFMSEERVDVDHILIRTKGEGRDEAASQALAEEVHAKLARDPSRFEALAKEYSEDPKTAPQGGKLGWLATKKLVKPFREAAVALKPGEISAPVKTRFGFHVIRLVAYAPAERLPFEKVKPGLMKQAAQQARGTAISSYLKQLKGSNAYRYDEAAVQQFFETYYAKPAPSRDTTE
jgi:peptidyl-prolyl cis-trans isomerase C